MFPTRDGTSSSWTPPYEINLPEGYSLRIGFDYEQLTRNSTPISAVKVGTIYPSYLYRGGNWVNYGVNTTGNLSVQCIAENDNFPQYIIRAQDLYCKGNLKTGDDLAFSFQAYNLGTTPITTGNLTFDVAIDGPYPCSWSIACSTLSLDSPSGSRLR